MRVASFILSGPEAIRHSTGLLIRKKRVSKPVGAAISLGAFSGVSLFLLYNRKLAMPPSRDLGSLITS